jgi:hypothetical protein
MPYQARLTLGVIATTIGGNAVITTLHELRIGHLHHALPVALVAAVGLYVGVRLIQQSARK